MDVAEQIRADLVQAVRWTAEFSGRSAQTEVGPSEVGHPCDRRLAYRIAGHPVVNRSEPLPAFLGTGAHLALADALSTYQGQDYDAWERWARRPDDEAAFAAAMVAPYRDNPRYSVETRVRVPGLGADGADDAGGTCDLFDHHRSAVIDHKVVGAWSLNRARRHGPSPTYRVQAHTYGLGWEYETGQAPKWVAVAFWPREKSLKYNVQVALDYMWVWAEPYDRAVALGALERLHTIRATVGELDTERFPDLFGSFNTIADACRFCPWHNRNAADPGQGCPGA